MGLARSALSLRCLSFCVKRGSRPPLHQSYDYPAPTGPVPPKEAATGGNQFLSSQCGR